MTTGEHDKTMTSRGRRHFRRLPVRHDYRTSSRLLRRAGGASATGVRDMRHDVGDFLLRSQQSVVDGYRQVLAVHRDMTDAERAGIEARLQREEEQLRRYSETFARPVPRQRAAA
jgi:hypothetical protein